MAVLTAIALVIHVVESLFPPLFIPGAKMGLSNIVTLITLCLMGPVDALLLVVVRTTVGAMFAGGFSTLIYSLPAGLISALISALLANTVFPRISLVAVSVVAATVHNMAQNLLYCLVTGTPRMLLYLPYLALAGVVAGFITGYTAYRIMKHIPETVFKNAVGTIAKQS